MSLMAAGLATLFVGLLFLAASRTRLRRGTI
jgi:hypothetical protein